MILFVTGQYAGAQYIHPLFRKWENSDVEHPEYRLVATGSSVKYWLNSSIIFDEITAKNNISVVEYLVRIRPKLIILSASGSEALEYLFILEAKKLCIKTVNYIDTWTNYTNRYIYNGEKIYPDTILSIDEICTKEMIEEGVPAEIIQEIGQPYLEDICKDIPPLGEKILIPIQPIKKARGDSLGYDEEDFLKLTLEAAKASGKFSDFYITSHPDSNLDMFDQEDIVVKEGKGVDDIKNSYTVLGMFSMQMIIGYLWGRKVASVQPNLKVTDPSPLSRWGLVPNLESKQSLINFITENNEKYDRNHKQLLNNIKGSQCRLEDFIMNGIIS
jgi:hypothetical protein